MLPFKSLLALDSHKKQPVYLQIVNAIIQEINKGVLTVGLKLPGTREMANLLQLNRKTVIMAYDELAAQGWIIMRRSVGTFINTNLPHIQFQTISSKIPLAKEYKNCGFSVGTNTVLTYQSYPEGHYLEIDEGVPDVRIAPVDDLYKRCKSIAMSRIGKKLLKYHDINGEILLRKSLARYLSETRGMHPKPENIFITRGSQMAIFLIFNCLLKPGDRVVVGTSNYQTANAVIRNTGAQIETIPVDRHGISIHSLDKLCIEKPIRAIYITPHHHYPTTVTLSAQRRLELLSLAEKHRFMILEDDYDYDFHYSSNPILPLASIDRYGLVIYVGGFSKLLASAIRIGYIVAPLDLMVELNKLRKVIDRQGDPVMERALAEMMEDGAIQRHLKKAVRIYQARRDFFCHLLEMHLKDLVSFNIPEGGMVVWTIFKKTVNLNQLALGLKKSNILINTEKDFVKKYNAIRFGFASLNHQEMEFCVKTMADILKNNKTNYLD